MKKKLNTDEFIKRSIKNHKNKYDYSISNYTNAKTKIKIICPEHGEFEQLPHNHMKGVGCMICGIEKTLSHTRSNKKKFIEFSEKIHGDKYDYSLIDYKNAKTRVKIICPEHGEFEQTPHSHINNARGCSKCVLDKSRDNLDSFIQKSKKTHGDKYDYSLVEYIQSKIKVKIICPEHNIFTQEPSSHIRGYGCIKCKSYKESKGEKIIREILEINNISFTCQKIFDDCVNINPLPFDFYLPEHNICIEFDGIQHYIPVKYFGGLKKFKETQKRDNIKNEYCNKNNIILIRIKYNQNIEDELRHLLIGL